MSSRDCRSRTFQHTILILLLILLIHMSNYCNGSRTTNVFNTSSPRKENDVVSPQSRPHHRQVKDHKSVEFLGFLPRQFPVPASGPSRKHNSIGLTSTTKIKSSP
ncbi:unnamed protein product [Cochlearia groenlandica]